MSDLFNYNYKKLPDTSKFITVLSYFNMLVGLGTLKSELWSYQFILCFVWSVFQHLTISKVCQNAYGENLWWIYPVWASAVVTVCVFSSLKLNQFHRELQSFDKKLKKICGNTMFYFLPLKHILLSITSFIIVFLFSMYCVVYLLNNDEIIFSSFLISFGFVGPFYSVFIVNLMFSYMLTARFKIITRLWTQRLVLHRSGPVQAELGLEKLRVLHSELKNIVILFNEATTLRLLLFFSAIFMNVLFIFYLIAYGGGIHVVYIVNALFYFFTVFAVIQFTESLQTSVGDITQELRRLRLRCLSAGCQLQVQLLVIDVHTRPLSTGVCGFFIVNKELIVALMTAVTTYCNFMAQLIPELNKIGHQNTTVNSSEYALIQL